MAFRWEQWALEPEPSLGMSHTSVVVLRDGSLVTGAAADPSLVVRTPSGQVRHRIPVPGVIELHGLTLVEEAGEQMLWVADPGFRLRGGEEQLVSDPSRDMGQVLMVGLDGRTRRALTNPSEHMPAGQPYRPTGTAVDEVRLGGTGDIWVADGYGASLVHRFDHHGNHLATISGEEGAGRFQQPHDVFIDRRGDVPELLVADRVNGRIQAFDLKGNFRRAIAAGEMLGPTQMAHHGDALFITDLLAGEVVVLTGDTVTARLFSNAAPPSSWETVPSEWPNARGADGLLTAAEVLHEQFRAPHGIAIASDGTIFVSEWAIGERIVALHPV